MDRGLYVEGVPGIDKFALASRRGARCAVADSSEDFDFLPADWGYPGPKIRAAIDAANRDLSAGRALRPGRAHDRRVIAEPPFYVIEAAPAITFTFTGLLTDRQMHVRSGAGGLIPGLRARGRKHRGKGRADRLMGYIETVLRRHDWVATITISRPKRRNACEVGVEVITGVGDRAFSVGGDLEMARETLTTVPAIRTSGSTTGSARSEWLGLPLRTLRSYLPVK